MIDLTKTDGLQNGEGIWVWRLALGGAILTKLEEPELGNALLNGFRRFLRSLQSSPRWLRNPRTGRWTEFSQDSLEGHISWIESLDGNQPFELAISSCETWRDAPKMFCAIVRAAAVLRNRGTRSYLRFSLPAGQAQHQPDTVVDLVKELATILDADSGWTGYMLASSADESVRASYLQEEYATAQRFEGLDVGDVAITSVAARTGIKGVNWLTIVGPDWLSEIGGSDAMPRFTATGASIESAGQAVVVRAGREPVLGDRNRMESADLYRAVGRLLVPIRVSRHGRFHKLRGHGFFQEDETANWLSRFD